MMYVSPELRERMGKRRTSADIVFEYLSPGTAVYDRTTKADTYLALGVRELWLIDAASKTVELRHATFDGDTPGWEAIHDGTGETARSRVLSGWEVSVDKLFENL